ncbi:beta-lactamase class A [Hamadaea flava]|uniref:Beta-lactamase n=1 Tax=Hamadaea flava TaxID=1742688 RepID=A0ABV8LWL5_9ACTN|nr:serine hydrolase [Hamadaea flava]MCP2324604.1 beta-lactamase class A [Hamadaea flava]
MTVPMSRRAALGFGSVAAATAVFGTAESAAAEEASPSVSAQATPEQAAAAIGLVYKAAAKKAGGTWNAKVSVEGAAGPISAVAAGVDDTVESYSVNKIPVAIAVLDKVDRGLLALDQRIEVTSAIVIPGGDGIFSLDGAYPSSVTLGHALAALLTVSDDTAVRLCGLVAPALEINQILVAKGFPRTQVEPVANPNRFFLGTTTPTEMHDLLRALVRGDLLSPASTAYLVGLLRSPIAFTDGVRREMSSDERARIATKAGWFDDGRNEAGIVFDTAGEPLLTYAFFARGQANPEDFGATHPAVQARAVMGRAFLTILGRLTGATEAATLVTRTPYRPSNGG